MDLLWQINYEEMLSSLIVTAFIILLNASVVVVCSMVTFPLIDLAFKKKNAKPAPTPPPIETWQHDDLTSPAWLSGRPWLAMRWDYLRPNVLHPPLAPEGMAPHAFAHAPLEHITPLIVRSLMPKGSEGTPTRPVTAPPTPLRSPSLGKLFSAKGRPQHPDDPNKAEPARPPWAA
jgi:hypothetical protein